MKIMLVAGEHSGDGHGAALARALRAARPDLKLFGLGGAGMREAGVEILFDPTRIAVVGLTEVLKHWPDFKRMFNLAVAALDERKPDLVVLIDYPGFNLRFAEQVKRRGIPLVYFISPQIWAWGGGRIRKIKQLVNRMLVLFPFEEALYKKAGVPVTFIGHPFIESVKPTGANRLEALEKMGLADGMPVIGLLPGSREKEVTRLLPTMLAACERLEQALPSTARFLLIKVPNLPWELYRPILAASPIQPKVVERWDYDGLYACDLVLVASGSATLECALLERPMVILYKTSWPTYLLSRLLIRIPVIGLANIAAGRKIAPELIQRDASAEKIAETALALWQEKPRREKMQEAFKEMRRNLGGPGAIRRAAQEILRELPAKSGS
ncbi:MAG: lipid-A-disaccharide synthase [Candidatus Omnitrophica bacterium CG11_big_fil_rev_8_21_14_0_20_64_10]|nr:MAG: lipid-A-disaccharide synthase [Candidatus Omnitrophica bacterium CG11_big_fil_rev_8_21_14_0_20_64_10]